MRKITLKEWERIEDALMRAEVPYKVNFDSHGAIDSSIVVYDKIINIESFTVVRFEEVDA